ncbi:guanitoxin biosynthesis L-enduracididine beta-hydroxylase GntD [Streptomyces sp. NRRL B-3648]|uniref:guanitoxin biosynthesis L-enduracididine beta-hydroxylase GntD n=1 Tax=Streptomyces sp. NRRL B-3648 TaxID=1519493 RepID=UPI00099DD21A|nr:guanitoxin biosynthesis L-enduracididine beta-hydroxylase GntD [Streptomyces sp. NRRL B-3648]
MPIPHASHPPGPTVADAADPADDGFVHRCTLTDTEAKQALDLAHQCAQEYGRVDDPRFLAEMGVLAHALPQRARFALHAAARDSDRAATVIAGNQVDSEALGPTPAGWQAADTPASRPYAFLLMLFSALLGETIAWRTQQDGRMVGDVVPTEGLEHSLISASSHSELSWHTEDAFSPYRADWVGLMCLRNAELTPTTLAVPELGAAPEGVVEVLRQRRFHVVPDNAHVDPPGQGADPAEVSDALADVTRARRTPPPVALVSGPPEAFVVRVDRDFTSVAPGDEEAARALAWLIANLDANLRDLPLAPGDIAFVDNRNAVHGRRSFHPRYNGTDRWLKRVNIVRDLRRTRPGRASATSRTIG